MIRRPWLQDQRGAVAVEFALTFGLVVTLLLVTLDLGRWLNAELVLTMAAREGARRAAVMGGDYPEVRDRIAELAAAARLADERLEVRIEPMRARYGTTITVELEFPFRPLSPMLLALVGPEVTLRAAAITRSERLAPGDEG
ncbi:MAG TPA: TadE/TadG family type IV pilus assembly protein [Bacillota bacterium]